MTSRTLIEKLNKYPDKNVAIFDEVWLTALPIKAVCLEDGGIVLYADDRRENLV